MIIATVQLLWFMHVHATLAACGRIGGLAGILLQVFRELAFSREVFVPPEPVLGPQLPGLLEVDRSSLAKR